MATPKTVELLDRGFDSDFSSERIDRLLRVFGSEAAFQELIDQIHEEDNTIDMKRGEFYPEILRCVASMKRALAHAYEVDPRQAHPNFGSNGSIDTILVAMKLRELSRGIDTRREGGLLVATPTYFRNYNSCASKHIRLVQVPVREEDWQVDLARFLQALETEKPTVVFLVTPNNPTGLAIPDDAIVQILDAVPNDVLVVMDRTLANIAPEVETNELLARYAHKQLAVLHSLSKYSGMSHLRIGFALYSQLAVAEEIRPLLPLGLGVEGLVKATQLLVRHGPLRPNPTLLANIRENKEVLADFCAHRDGFWCTDFVANYCLMGIPARFAAADLAADLMRHGIYVMAGTDFPEPGQGLLRVHTGGRPAYMKRLVDAMSALT